MRRRSGVRADRRTCGWISRTATDAAPTTSRTACRPARAGKPCTALGDRTRAGIRIKGLTSAERCRALRTLELVLDARAACPTGSSSPCRNCGWPNRLPPRSGCARRSKHSARAARAARCVSSCRSRARRRSSARTAPPRSPRRFTAAEGRCTGLHYGTYDYSAACGSPRSIRRSTIPVADHAKAVMLAAAAQTGVWVVRRLHPGDARSAPTSKSPRRSAATTGSSTRSLERGFYQGWDMHPGHLVTRWLATFAFFRTGAWPRPPAPAGLPRPPRRRRSSTSRRPRRRWRPSCCAASAVGAFDADDVLAHRPRRRLCARACEN